mgnify:CR=1 FL=1
MPTAVGQRVLTPSCIPSYQTACSCLHAWRMQRVHDWRDASRCGVCRQRYSVSAQQWRAAAAAGVIDPAELQDVQRQPLLLQRCAEAALMGSTLIAVLSAGVGLLYLVGAEAAAVAEDPASLSQPQSLLRGQLAQSCLFNGAAYAFNRLAQHRLAQQAQRDGEPEAAPAQVKQHGHRLLRDGAMLGAALCVQRLVATDRSASGEPARQPALEAFADLAVFWSKFTLGLHLGALSAPIRLLLALPYCVLVWAPGRLGWKGVPALEGWQAPLLAGMRRRRPGGATVVAC